MTRFLITYVIKKTELLVENIALPQIYGSPCNRKNNFAPLIKSNAVRFLEGSGGLSLTLLWAVREVASFITTRFITTHLTPRGSHSC